LLENPTAITNIFVIFVGMQGQSAAKILNNKIIGSVQIISDIPIIINNRKQYLTKCLICSKESTRRLDHLEGKNIPQYCKYCRDSSVAKLRVSTNTPFNALYSNCRTGAKSRKLEFNITKEEALYIMLQNCYYCNNSPKESSTSKKNNRTDTPFFHNGIDRLDSKIGYIKNNCVPCCGVCNMMKNKFPKDLFFEQISKIYNNCLK